MAHKKKHHKKTPHRRRVGAVREGSWTQAIYSIVGVAGGIIGGRLLNNVINSPTAATPAISPTILGAGELAVGGFVGKKMKHPFIKGVLYGAAGNGLMYALSAKGLNVLPASIGYGPDAYRPPNRAQLTGFRDVPKIGFPKPTAIGAPRDMSRLRRAYAGVYGC